MVRSLLPDGFVVLSQIAPKGHIDLKYTGHDNLLGRPLRGYAPDGSAILTEPAAHSIAMIIDALQSPGVKRSLGLQDPTLLILEAYRPLQAGEDFWEWAHNADQTTKEAYYPRIEKSRLFELGYIARRSSHSRGSTVDLTIIDSIDGKVNSLDMGTPFDYMDDLSHPTNVGIDPQAYAHRQFLRQLMHDNGWQGINQEWWHFTYKNEPFPDTYFDFEVVNHET